MDESQSPVAERTSRRMLALGLAALLCHAPTLRNGFVLDDHVLLAENPFMRSWGGLLELLRHELFVASAEPRMVPYYRPISGLVNWLSYQLFADSAPWQHALNLLLHAGVTASLFRAACALGVRASIAFGGALLFAAHPATAEVVAYIGGRQDMLGWLIGLTALGLTKRLKCGVCAAVLGFSASLLGALCHELFIGLFVPLALIVVFNRDEGARSKAAAVFTGGALAVAALFGLRAWLGLLDFEANIDGPWPAARATAGVALRLFKDALAPTDLAVDVSVPLPGGVVTCAVLLGGSAAALALGRRIARKRRDLVGPFSAGVALVGLCVALHAGVVLKYGIVSDRYAYALLVGLALSLMVSAETWLPLAASSSPLTSVARKWGPLGLALAMLPLTWSRDASWHDQRSLQLAMIAERPDDPESWLAEAMLSFGAGDVEQAYPRCKAYADARPASDKANLCIGSWLLLQRRAAEAVTYLRPYALSRPGLASARRTFLYALLASGQYDELSRVLRDWSPSFAGAPELVEARAALEAARRDGPPR